MYLPSHFTETDRAEIAALIDARPLAALVVATNRGLVANHIPLLRDDDGLLVGHIAIAKACDRAGVPFTCWKFLTDLADENATANWRENVEKGASAFIGLIDSGGLES